MTREIERKWLADGWPVNLQSIRSAIISQSYLYVNDDIEVRLHSKTDPRGGVETSYTLTIKMGEGLERVELEKSLTKEEYEAFASEVKGDPIKKDYRIYNLNGYKLGVSHVENTFYYAEIEFDSVEQANQYELPLPWMEVTGNWLYSMKNYWAATRFN